MKQYLRKSRCPKCGSAEIYTPSDGFLAQAGHVGHLYGHCTECGAQWNEIWKITGLKMLEAVLPEESRKWVQPWKRREETNEHPHYVFQFRVKTSDLPPCGKAIVIGGFVIVNDDGELKVYE